MRWLNRALLTAIGCGVCGAAAADDITPAGGFPPRKSATIQCPPVSVHPPCPPLILPGQPGIPGQPMPAPTPPGQTPSGQSEQPAQPGQTPPSTTPPGTTPSSVAGGAGDLLASASAAGTGAGLSLLPNVNGDLLGGGGVAGPIIVTIAPDGRIVGRNPVIVFADGRRVPLRPDVQAPTDELIRNRAPLRTAPPGSTQQAVFPPDGAVFDSSFADAVVRTPQIVRGPFKVTENDSPRPRTRLYASYYFYDQVFKGFGGVTPRVTVHQQVFGGEYAFLDEQASVGIRLPYNQLVGGTLYSDTGLGDLTLTSKMILWENEETGSLISAGLLVTAPTGNRPFRNSITGETISGTLIQPYLGYIYQADRAFLQGFTSLVIPTDDNDVTLLTNDFQAGYFAYQNQGAFLSAVVPTAELHINTPLDHRGKQTDPVGFVDQVTVLGGLQMLFRDRAGLGVAVGAPVTGPRPYSLQATVQFNLWF